MIRTCVVALCAVVGVAAGGVPTAGAAPTACPTGIASTMRLVNDYWQAHNRPDQGVRAVP